MFHNRRLSLTLALSAFFISESALAYPSYLGNFTGYYSENGIEVTKFKDNLRCQTCHTSSGGGERNSYGRDIEFALGSGNTFGSNEFKDSDSDGFINLEEIFAQTAPGFAEMKPSARIEIKATSKVDFPTTLEISLPATFFEVCDVTLKSFGYKFTPQNETSATEMKPVADFIVKLGKGEKLNVTIDANAKGTILAKCDAMLFVGSLTISE